MPIAPIDPIQEGESGASVRAKLNLLLAGAVSGDLGTVTPEDLQDLVDTIGPDRIDDLVLTSTLEPSNLLIATWGPSLADDLAYYDLQIKEGSGSWIGYTTSSTVHRLPMIPVTTYTGRVRAVDQSGNPSPWSVEFTHTTVRDNIPPAMPIGLVASGGLDSTWLEWVPNTETDLARYEIFESLTDAPVPENSSTPTYTVFTNALTLGGQAPEVTRYYYVRAVDTSDNASPWSAVAEARTAKVRSEIKVALEDIIFTPAAGLPNRIAWSSGTINYGTDGDVPTTQAIPAGHFDYSSGRLFIYYILGASAFSATTSLIELYAQDSVIIGSYKGGTDFTLVEGRAYTDGALILAQTIGANQLVADQAIITGTAQIANAIISDAKILDLSAAKLQAGTALAGSITVSGQALSTTTSRANDPAARINAASTQIDPGKIVISGATSLADWRSGADTTKIDGGNLYANSVKANSLEIGLRNITTADIAFTGNDPSSNRISWTGGTITYIDDDGSTVSTAVSANAAGVQWTSGTLYIYWTKGATSLSSTTSAATAFATNSIVLATYRGGINVTADYGRTIIDGAGIKTGTITATQIAAQSISGDEIAAGAILAIHIGAGAVTAGKIDVSTLSAIVANIGTVTAGVLRSADSKFVINLDAGTIVIKS